MKIAVVFVAFCLFAACNFRRDADKQVADVIVPADSTIAKPDNTKVETNAAPAYNYNQSAKAINTGNTTPEELVAYAKTLINVPYKYASVDPHLGFDCSGFITYVFNNFNIGVPRSSKDFTDLHREVQLDQAKAGDIILFTGTDTTDPVVGHMGIIIGKENGEHLFIHSSSGKANGVTVTPLQDYYMSRFVKIIRIFKQNDASS
jgi:cell wall-associated NlpC family hydrolase